MSDTVQEKRGPCAKRQVVCVIVGSLGREYRGENNCENPQSVCPRLPGEGYEKCKSVCRQSGHAEIEALRAAGAAADGGTAHIYGHYWICELCGDALRKAGILHVVISPYEAPPTSPEINPNIGCAL